MAKDEYGNTIARPIRSTKEVRRGTARAFRELTGRRGYVPLRTGRRQTFGGAVREDETRPFPNPPANWLGSLPEWAIYWAHGAIGLREGQDFEYLFRYGFGSINAAEPAQFDFFEFDLQIAIEIQGLYWHYEFGGRNKIAQDQERKARAEAVGLTLIFIDEDDAVSNPIYFLRQARNGIDRSRVTRGF